MEAGIKARLQSVPWPLRAIFPALVVVGLIVAVMALTLVGPAQAQSDSTKPRNLTAEIIPEKGVKLSWEAPAEDAESVTGYQVLRRLPRQGEPKPTVVVADTGSTATSYTDKDATVAGEQYNYRVKALRGDQVSKMSNLANVTLPSAEPTPTPEPEPTPNPTRERSQSSSLGTPQDLTGEAIFQGGVDLQWNEVPGADHYEVQLYDAQTGDHIDLPHGSVEVALYGAGAVVSGLQHEDASYNFRVRASNEIGTSDWSQWLFMSSTDQSDAKDRERPGNAAPTGHPVINGTAEVGNTLTADTSGIADANGLDRVKFQHQWVWLDGSTDRDIAGATNSEYTLTAADSGRWVKVRVSYTDRAGYTHGGLESVSTDQVIPEWSATLTVGKTETLAPVATGYSRQVIQDTDLAPAEFTLDGTTYVVAYVFHLAEGLFFAVNRELPSDFILRIGDYEYAGRDSSIQPARWPGSYWWGDRGFSWTPGETVDVSLTMDQAPLPTREQAPPTAYFSNIPSDHNGVDTLEFRLNFTGDVAITDEGLRHHGLVVDGGTVKKVQRVSGGKAWLITVEPDSDADVGVSLYKAAGCQEQGAICSGDGDGLHYHPTLTVPGPATMAAQLADASLASLAVDGAVMDTAFDPLETLYTAQAASGGSQITVHAEASRSAEGATVSIIPEDADLSAVGHQVALSAGAETTISVAVTAPDGATVVRYWLVVSEASAAGDVSSTLNDMQLTGLGTLDFDDQQIRYELPAPTGESQTTVVASRSDTGATVEVFVVRAGAKGLVVDEDDADPNVAGRQVRLSETGDTLVIVRVTSADGLSQSLYLTLITRTSTPPNDAQVRDTRTVPARSARSILSRNDPPALSELSVSSTDLVPPFGPGAYDFTATVDHDVSEVTVNATGSGGASVTSAPVDRDTINPGIQVALGGPGSETAITVVASSGGQMTSYTITVTRVSDAAFHWNPTRDITLENNPNLEGIWSDRTTLWAVSRSQRKILAYDLATGDRVPDSDINKLQASGNSEPRGLWSDGIIMWVSDCHAEKVYAYDLATGDRRPSRDIGVGDECSQGLWSDGTTLWFASWGERKVYAYDLATGDRAPGADIPLNFSRARDLWSDGTTLWVVKYDLVRGSQVRAYDLATGALRADLGISRASLESRGSYRPKGVWSDGTTMWISDANNDELHAFNMPQTPLLRSLELSGASFLFSSGRRAYTVRVPSTTASVTVTAEAGFATSSVDIDPDDADAGTLGSQVNLSPGDNTITVTVTNGANTATYTLTVTRTGFAMLSGDANLSALSLSGIDIGAFDAATREYRAYVADSVVATTITATPAVSGSEVDIDPDDDDGDATGHQVHLTGVVTKIVVTVESTDGTQVKSYIITVIRASDAAFDWNYTKDITLENDPDLEGIWSDRTTLWAVDRSQRKILAYDLATGDRVPGSDINNLSASGISEPGGLWSDGIIMWVSDFYDKKVYAYDLATGDRMASRDIAVNVYCLQGLWSNGIIMWVVGWANHKLYAYDLATGDRVPDSDIALSATGNHWARDLWSDGTTMWVSGLFDNNVLAYDLATGDRRTDLDISRGSLQTAEISHPQSAWSDGTTMWIYDGSNELHAFNMPESPLLSSLELSGVSFVFSSGRRAYTVQVPSATASVTVTAEAAFDTSSVDIDPDDNDTGTDGYQVSLSPGNNTITITVTNGADSATYTVIVNRLS